MTSVWSPEVTRGIPHFRKMQDIKSAHHSHVENFFHKVKYTKNYWLNFNNSKRKYDTLKIKNNKV